MKNLTYLFLAITLIWSCKQAPKSHEGHDHDGHKHADNTHEAKSDGITITAGDYILKEAISLPYSDAVLELNEPGNGTNHSVGKVAFDFDVSNYELGSQTGDKNASHCANSAKGQHIHLILNNAPYTAHYVSDFEKELEEGSYVGLAFLSRSYHESIKSPTAFQVFNFSVGKDVEQPHFDKEQPHMFYSRPKGKYVGKDTERVMLDFYLINAELSSKGYKVIAKINNQTVELTKWAPYLIEGLPMGENTIELTLLDAEGKKVESPFNPVTRTVTLAEE